MTILENLTGKKILSAAIDEPESLGVSNNIRHTAKSKIEAPLQLIVDQFCLNIYNPYTILGLVNYSVNNLVGNSIDKVIENDDSIAFLISGEIEIRIDMRLNSYTGPEAISLSGPNNLIVIW
jgi:hypothetical protein